LKYIFNPRQHGFIKSKSTSTNLVAAYPDFITPLVYSQHKVDDIYFDFCNTFCLDLYALVLHKLDDFGLSTAYVAWFHSYKTNRLSHVCCHGTLSVLYEVLSRVPQGSVLGPLLFYVFTNDLCSAVKYSNHLLFSDDTKIYQEIKYPYDSWLLQSSTVQCTSDYMKLNNKTRVISFCRKTNWHGFDYKL
jgi:hypothetical protein